MRKLRVVLLVVSCSAPMLGQANLEQTYKGELFGGYSFEHIAPGCGSDYRCGNAGPTANINGFAASATGYFYKSLGITAQVTGNYHGAAILSYATVNRYTYQFGPAYSFHLGKANAFAHALLGGVSQSSSPRATGIQSTDPSLNYRRFLWSVGGGLDWKASSRISIRVAQVDYERQSVPVVNTGGPAPIPPVGVSGLRYSAGIVWHF